VIAFFKPWDAYGLDSQEYGISIASWFGMIAASSRVQRFLLGRFKENSHATNIYQKLHDDDGQKRAALHSSIQGNRDDE
jgi:hypothetical protein